MTDRRAKPGKARPGRGMGPTYAPTAEYDRLTRFLRRQKQEAGLTLKDLAESTGRSTTWVGERLQGKGLDLKFAEGVVRRAAQADPRLALLREKNLNEARRLWRLAQENSTPIPPADVPLAPELGVAVLLRRTLSSQDTIIDLRKELHDQERRLSSLLAAKTRSEQALIASTALIGRLSVCVLVLADEMEELTRWRDEARQGTSADPVDAAAAEEELGLRDAQRRRAQDELGRAERDRGTALLIYRESIRRARELRRRLVRLRESVEDDTGQAAPRSPLAAMVLDDLDLTTTLGDGIDEALDRAEDISRRISEELQDALADLSALPAPSVGVLAADMAEASGEDHDVGSRDGGDRWWSMLADVPAEVLAWAEALARALLEERDPHDPRLVQTAVHRSVREVLLVADTLVKYQWLEGAARLHIALAVSADEDELVELAIALLTDPSPLRTVIGKRIVLNAVAQRPPEDALRLCLKFGEYRDESQDPQVLESRLRDVLMTIATRPHAEVKDMVVRQLTENSRLLTHGPIIAGIVRHWTAREIAAFLDELPRDPAPFAGGLRETFAFQVFFELPAGAKDKINLLVHLWEPAPREVFTEMIPAIFDGDAGYRETVTIVAELHRAWPAPLATSAAELAEMVLPHIIERTPLWQFERIGDALRDRGLDPAEVFAPYRGYFETIFKAE